MQSFFVKTHQQPASPSSSEQPFPYHAASQIRTCCWLSSILRECGQQGISRTITYFTKTESTNLVGQLLLIGLTSLISLIASSHLEILLSVRDCFRYSSKFCCLRVEAEILSAIFLNSLSHHVFFGKDRQHGRDRGLHVMSAPSSVIYRRLLDQFFIVESIATTENNLNGDYPRRFHAFSRDARGIGIELSQRRTILKQILEARSSNNHNGTNGLRNAVTYACCGRICS